ncbi:dTDP-4-dehydrorhamnose reductase [Niabella ginsenosidivorans]|uniref:dTDP-4-dehydrorhamnose reductase n=1 Tax=Niabella ginsenosidivorans TaxID=1176587 RepID=A0A1A9I4C8_9BACT|nr:dTDP-4-dehydrorhamnose reductase [Niabella ginsenosidivorans]ANH81531.1 dTDP-4-dehydrorhamnose reductase [Niabella ginsenosidivorans]
MNRPVKIFVTGSSGQLGSELQTMAALYPDFLFEFTTQKEVSITDATAVNQLMNRLQPDYCINCAAYTAVDKAEEAGEALIAEKVNADAAGILARACRQHGTKLIHLSTDYVFDGTATSPYLPGAPTRPVSVYGKTKLKGEQLAASNTDAVIIRTAWVYSAFGKNFVKTMIRLMTEKSSINVVSDQYGSPTYANDLAKAILDVIASGNWVPGIYHYTNEGVISWYDFAVAIKELIRSSCTVNAIPTSAYPTPAKRPAYSVLDKTSFKDTFRIEIPYWESSLKKCIEILMNT